MSIARWMELHDTECHHALPACKHDGCTGATVSKQWSPFCSQLCAALWAIAECDQQEWCNSCSAWVHDDECLCVRRAKAC